MPLKKLLFRPGVSRENTRYLSENVGPTGVNGAYSAGWYECDKIRFRSGSPEKIGGWDRISANSFLGVCRSLWNWVTLGGANLLGVGTNLKFYIENGGSYYDITPIRGTPGTINNNPFVATLGSSVITVTDTAHGCFTGDFVTFSGAVGLGGNITAGVLNAEYQVTVVNANTYTITVSATANATDVSGSPGGGASVVAAYQINTGFEYAVPLVGWGAGGWGAGPWGTGTSSLETLRLWSQFNFGEDLIFGPRGGGIYYWDSSAGTGTRAVNLTSLGGASDVPTVQNFLLVSDVSRFVLAFGCNDLGSADQNPMLIRWSDQEDAANWTPAATNQAGGLQLSRGSEIITAIQSRQEVIVFTDNAVYAMQYLGPPAVWGATLLADNTSIVSQNAVTIASGVTFWMGVDKFYKYDGRVQTLRCDLRQYIFSDLDKDQYSQVFAGTNEGFNEVWWFYCSAGSQVVDKYVVYNYLEDIWYYGTMGRTAWLDSGLRDYPIAATYVNNIVNHESGVDDNSTAMPAPIAATITSAEFDLDDGHNFMFLWRVLPDITFRGSEASAPSARMYMQPLKNSGSGYTTPPSVGGENNRPITRTAVLPIEEFTGQIFTRVRARQMSVKVESDGLGVTWQLGAPRLDLRPDGRR
jgi:hypothetical protein